MLFFKCLYFSMFSHSTMILRFITAHTRNVREGNVFSLSLNKGSLDLRLDRPPPPDLAPDLALDRYPPPHWTWHQTGTPTGPGTGQGTSPLDLGLDRGTPPPELRQDRGTSPTGSEPGRSGTGTELDVNPEVGAWAVRLLRSRRRTVLSSDR